MNRRNVKNLVVLWLGVLAIVFAGCKDRKTLDRALVVRQMADPDMLNPLNFKSDNARVINSLIFAGINSMELKCEYDLVPFLTKQIGIVSEITEGEFNGGMRIEYEIREEAKWDNGEPVTANDYVFTIKAILNPKTHCEHLKSYYDWIGDVVVDPTNPRKYVVYSKKKYFKIEEFAGYIIIPEYNYDPKKIMRNFSIRDLNDLSKIEELKLNSEINAFATEFNSEKYQRDPKFISGLGPYTLESWTTGQELVIKRKENWWGDQFKDDRHFWAYPKKIKFKIINDQNTALTALKDDGLDIFYGMPAKEFMDLDQNREFKNKFRTDKKDILAYTFLYFNLRNKKFQDLNVRKAITHAINRKKINEAINNGESVLTESFIHPSQKTYDRTLKPYEFDLKLANQLLDEAGWIDTDGDGIRDKEIDGQRVPLTVNFKYNAGNEQRKNTALIIQEDFVKIGISMQIEAKEWSVFIQELGKHQFEMTYAGFAVPPRIGDPRQTWHTENAIPGADNNSGWGGPESDKLIEDIGKELDPDKRKQMYITLQQMIHADLPVVFLFAPKNRLALSRRYDVEFNLVSPGFLLNEFKLAQ
jgi:peptide/nickel transport system substrate-binding protein